MEETASKLGEALAALFASRDAKGELLFAPDAVDHLIDYLVVLSVSGKRDPQLAPALRDRLALIAQRVGGDESQSPEEVAEKIAAFVRAGGTFVATYWSGIVDENDLCFLGGFPGPLREVLGVWAEEIDALGEGDENAVRPVSGEGMYGLSGEYAARELCELVHAESAQMLATYVRDFYAGRPALTVNQVGEGQAYTIASRNENRFLDDFYGVLSAQLGVRRSLDVDLPAGVSAQVRTDGEREYVFMMNVNAHPVSVDLGDATYTDLLTGTFVAGRAELDVYGVMVLTR